MKNFIKQNRSQLTIAAAVALVVIVSGLVWLTVQAAGFFLAVESDTATLTTNAKVVTDATASGGKAIEFTATPVTPPTTPPPTTPCPNVKHTPGGPDGMGGCWPFAGNTGIPSGTVLSAYAGPCTITTNNTVITAKTINCSLDIRAVNVQISNSKINGVVWIEEPESTSYSFSITDSEINVGGIQSEGIGKGDFTLTRVHVYGGHRSVWCEFDCTVVDSWVHGQTPDPTGVAHESGIRMGDGSTLRHNSIRCDAPDYPPDAGCSASLTGYGDFAPIRNNLIEKNLFVATTGGACAYGGSSGRGGVKPYGDAAENIRFIDNIFQRKSDVQSSGKCGYYFPITDFDSSRPRNQWVNNRWDDGAILNP